MQNDLKRTQIGDGIYFNTVTDKRFKTNIISITMLTELKKETAAVNAIIPFMLTITNENYPEMTLMSKKLAGLYGADISSNVMKNGDTQALNMSISTIDDIYALPDSATGEKEKVTTEITKILADCLTKPVVKNNAFDDKTLAVQKENLISMIESELNDKRVYARNKTYDLMCKGEGAGVRSMGYTEDVRRIDAENAYKAYLELLKTAEIEIICIGCNDFEKSKQIITESLKLINRSGVKKHKSERSKVKKEVVKLAEQMDVNQAKMYMGFKVANDNVQANRVFQKLFGGTTTSKLFLNVREKLSLCYYCAASYNMEKGILTVDCGVEHDKISQARAEILNQLDEVKKGNFTDEDLYISALDIMNNAKTSNDSVKALEMWYLSKIYQNDIKKPEEDAKPAFGITAKDVIKAASSLTLDTIYVLTSENESVEGIWE